MRAKSARAPVSPSVGRDDIYKVIVDTKILKDMISVIRTEQIRRMSLLQDEDTNFLYDQWSFSDGPFINELCLMFLVTLRHQIEREVVRIAARSNENRIEISGKQYQENIRRLRKINQRGKNIGWDWKEISKRLNLETYENYKFIEALRLLSNLYKHEPSMEPDDGLLKLLGLEIGVSYASLPESGELQKGFAKFVGLESDANYCDIAERFVDISNTFLSNVKNRTKLTEIKWGAASLNPDDFAR